MTLPDNGHLLRIYVGEADRHEGLALYDWIVRAAREHGLAGATVLRGLAGYGASSRVHTARILRLSEDLPVVIEIVDAETRLERFLERLDPFIEEGLATMEKAHVRFYRSRKK